MGARVEVLWETLRASRRNLTDDGIAVEVDRSPSDFGNVLN